MHHCPPVWLPLAALFSLAPLWGQGVTLPLPPSLAEVAELPAAQLHKEQVALKAVWLERLIRAREERHRVSRENVARCLLLAQKQGAPAAFVNMLRCQVAGNLPHRERYQLDSAQQELLAVYGVDAREMRFFVESCGLLPEQLREVAAWLPLSAVFNASPSSSEVTDEAVVAACEVLLEASRELALAWPLAVDEASADAVAEALLPVLERYLPAFQLFLAASDAQREAAVLPLAGQIAPVQEACSRERSRLMEQAWFGSHRLQALDYLLH